MSKRYLIKHAKMVNEGEQKEVDLLLSNGRIEQIAGEISGEKADEVLDASGQYLLPGLIDDQVHFREPGLTHKADIASESRAAVAGGVTSYMEMPNCKPPTIGLETLLEKRAIAEARSSANYAFYLGGTNDNLEAVKSIDPNLICGVKVFMGSSTGNMLVDAPKILEGIFASSPTLIATHCEDTPTIKRNEALYREKYGENVPFDAHPIIRNEEACYLSSSMAVELAKKHGAHLHILHITTAKELELFEAGPIENKHITSEACVHHMYFDQGDYQKHGSNIKCNPAIKTAQDREAILRAIIDDRIDVIATDHAPHTIEEKAQSYFSAPSGLPLVQHSLQTLLEHYHNGVFSLEKIVHKTSHAVAQRFKVKERGFIREGYWGDLVLVSLDTPYAVNKGNVLSKCGWSPFEGTTFRSSVTATFVSGQLAYANGQVLPCKGQALEFVRK